MEAAQVDPVLLRSDERSEVASLVAPYLVRAAHVIGDRWMIAILGQIFLGARRFNEVQRNLEIPRAVLSSRLNTAKAYGLIEQRDDYYDGRPRFFLTEKGRGLWTLLTVVMRWSDDFMAGGSGMCLIHTGCGEDSQATMTCTACGDPLGPDDLIPVAAQQSELP